MLRVLHVHIRVHFKPLYSHLSACLGSSSALQYLVKSLSDGLVSISLGNVKHLALHLAFHGFIETGQN